jgi:hypothetical protein
MKPDRVRFGLFAEVPAAEIRPTGFTCPSCNKPVRKWPARYFAEAGDCMLIVACNCVSAAGTSKTRRAILSNGRAWFGWPKRTNVSLSHSRPKQRQFSMDTSRTDNNGSLPYSEDAEKGVLCSLILSPREVAKFCAELLHPDAFYVPAHRIIYETLFAWPKDGLIDFVWLKSQLKRSRQLDEVGGPEFLNQLYTFVPSSSNAKYYVDILREKHALRRTILACNSLAKRCYDDQENIEPLLANAERQFSDIARQCNGNGTANGASLLEYSQREINHSDTLLGNRWLCRGGGAVIVGSSGIGKSTLAIQSAVLWACSRTALGIKTPRAHRVLIVQAEDDEGDCTEMTRMVRHLDLTEDHLKLIGENTRIEFLNDKTGYEFVSRLDQLLTSWPCDIVIINPLSAYLGADTKDEEKVNQFLRKWLNPVLTAHKVGVVFIHHTPKTTNRDTSNWKGTDWMYSGSGVAGITNWARAYLVIDPAGTHGVFRFIAAKRGERLGWSEFWWAHSREDGKLVWLPADRDQIALAIESSKAQPEDLLTLVPILDPISQDQLFQVASERNFGQKKIRQFLNILEEKGEIFRHKIPREGVKAAVGYSQSEAMSEE